MFIKYRVMMNRNSAKAEWRIRDDEEDEDENGQVGKEGYETEIDS